MTIQSVFATAGGSQIVLYETFTPGANATFSDTMGIGSTFDQPNAGNQPSLDTAISPAGKQMMSFSASGAADLMGDFGTGGIIASGSFPTWASPNIVVEHFIMQLPSSPDNATSMMMLDLDSDGWNRNQFGAGIIYRTGALTDSAMSGSTPYFVTCEHNCASGVSTLTVQGVTQSTTGTNSGSTRTDFLNYKLIGAKGDLSDPYTGFFGCYGIGYATTWGSTERVALYAEMDAWFNDLDKTIVASSIASAETFGRPNINGGPRGSRRLFRQFPYLVNSRARVWLGGVGIPQGGRGASQTLLEREFFGGPIQPTGIASAEAFGSATVSNAGGGGGGQTITLATSIASAEVFGVAKLNQSVAPSGIVTAEQLGAAKANLQMLLAGIASLEAVGVAQLNTNAKPTAIASAEAIGTAKLNLKVTTIGIGTAEAFGTSRFTIFVRPTAIASAETFGSTTLVPGAVSITPTGITSGEAVGAPLVSVGASFIFAAGVASAEAFGTPRFTLRILPTAIASGEAFGTPRFRLAIVPSSIASAEGMGTPTALPGAVIVNTTGIASAEGMGSPIVTTGVVFLVPTAIASAETFGTVALQAHNTLAPAAIASLESFGATRLVYAQNITPTAIASAETFGTLQISRGFIIPTPTRIEWSFRPTTAIVVRFLPSTTIAGFVAQASTKIEVRHTMAARVGATYDLVFVTKDPRTAGNPLFDPTTVSVVVYTPTERTEEAEGTTYVFGVDSNLTRDSLGTWRCAIALDEVGTWRIEIVTAGPSTRAGFEVTELDVE